MVLYDGWCGLGVRLQGTDGLLMEEIMLPAPYSSFENEALVAGDINGDGWAEIVYVYGSMKVVYLKGHAPKISVSPSSVEFGKITIGQSSSKTLTIVNKGNSDLSIGFLSLGDSEFMTSADHCSYRTLVPSEQCTIDVVFSPRTTTPGGRSLSFVIVSNDPDSPSLKVQISGSAIAPGPPSPTVSLGSPTDGILFNTCSLEASYQPSFTWTGVGNYQQYTILFSLDRSTFKAPLAKANIAGVGTNWSPSKAVWTKVLNASYNRGVVRDVYWKVVGRQLDKMTLAESEVRSFRIGDVVGAVIEAPGDQAVFSSLASPAFDFSTNCNVRFHIEISPLSDFSEAGKIKSFNHATQHPNRDVRLQETLPKGLWNQVRRLVGSGSGYFRIKASDSMNRDTYSEVRSFTIQ